MCWDTGELAQWHREQAAKTDGTKKRYHEAAARGFDAARASGDRHTWDKSEIEAEARKEAEGAEAPAAAVESRGIGAFVGRLRRRAVAH